MMPGPGISVMWHSRVRRCWFAWGRRSTSRCDVRQVRKKRDAEHGECGTFAANPKNQKSGRDVREVGWTSLFQAVAEPFAGAWQQGVKADPESRPLLSCGVFLHFADIPGYRQNATAPDADRCTWDPP